MIRTKQVKVFKETTLILIDSCFDLTRLSGYNFNDHLTSFHPFNALVVSDQCIIALT